MSDIPILPTFQEVGGEVRNPKTYGWTPVRCVLPGHEDRNASASVSEEFNEFACRVCAVSYDAPGLLMEIEGLEFGDAERKAASLAGGSEDLPRAPARRRGGTRVSRGSGDRGGWTPPWQR